MTPEAERVATALRARIAEAADAALVAVAHVIAHARMSVMDRVLWWSGIAFWIAAPLAIGIAIGRAW